PTTEVHTFQLCPWRSTNVITEMIADSDDSQGRTSNQIGRDRAVSRPLSSAQASSSDRQSGPARRTACTIMAKAARSPAAYPTTRLTELDPLGAEKIQSSPRRGLVRRAVSAQTWSPGASVGDIEPVGIE